MPDNNRAERTLVRRLALALALLTLVLYGRGLVHSRGAYGDAFHHLMNGIFVFDLLHAPGAALAHPFSYATAYYRRFPAVSLGYYPPVFPVIEGALMTVVGVSATTGQLAVLLLAVLLALFAFAWLRLRLEPWWAAGGAALLVTAPSLVYWGRDIMLEVPVLAFMVGALWLFERLLQHERPSWMLALGWAALATLALGTKQHALFLLGVFAVALLAARRLDLLRVPAVVVAAALVLLAAGLLVAWHLAIGGTPVRETLGEGGWGSPFRRLILERWLFYPKTLPALVGLPTLVAAALGVLWIALGRERGAAPILAWIALFYLMHSYNVARHPRYACLWVPPFAALAVIGLRHARLRLAGVSLGAAVLALVLAGSIVRALALDTPIVPSAYQRAADDLRDRMPPFSCLTYFSDRPGRPVVAYRLAVEELRLRGARLEAFGHILRADQVLRDPPEDVAIEELAARLRRWNVKYLLTESPRPARRGQERVARRFEALLARGEFREVASYPASLGLSRSWPERRVLLYERTAPLVFDPAEPPPVRPSRLPRLGGSP